MITEIILTTNGNYSIRALPCEVKITSNKEVEIFSKIFHLSAISKRSISKSRFLKTVSNENDDYLVYNNYGYGFVIYSKDLYHSILSIDPKDKTDIMFKLKDELISSMINLEK